MTDISSQKKYKTIKKFDARAHNVNKKKALFSNSSLVVTKVIKKNTKQKIAN